MKAKGWKILHALINRYHQGPFDDIVKALPSELQMPFIAQRAHAEDYSTVTVPPAELFESLHYSWLLAPMLQAPEPLREAVLSALSEHQRSGLARLLNMPIPEKPLSPAASTFILQLFHHHYTKQIPVISANIELGKLSPMLTFTKKQLVEVGDFLGLWDLAEDLRKVIDKKRLSDVYRCLPEKQQHFLTCCLQGRDRLSVLPIGIGRWTGDPKELLSLIHKRGLSRLGKAFSGIPREATRLLCRRLDTGRAKLLMQSVQRDISATEMAIVTTQIVNLLKFLEKEGNA
jgi:hypothetical protein